MLDQQDRFTKEQKIGVILLAAFVLLAVSLGILQMRNNLYKPFALNASIPPLIGQEVNTSEALRYRDTDFDGLSDFDELYIFSTSPYLADTDSDGIEDGEEIEKGTSPVCAEGTKCGTGTVVTEATTILTKPDNVSLYDQEAPASMEEYLQNPEVLRQILFDSGVNQDVLDKITDQELLIMSNDIFSTSSLKDLSDENFNTTGTVKFLNEIMSN